MIIQFTILTNQKYQLINITHKIEEIITKAKLREGIVLVFVPHSTAGILLTEEEEFLKKDWLKFFEKVVSEINFKHNQIDNNADAHLLSGLIGQCKTIPVKNEKLVLGMW